jgi:aromatic ring-cleaving dioxygenase
MMETVIYHVRIYYELEEIDLAKSLVNELNHEIPLEVGTFHEEEVGPHPKCSVQLTVQSKDIAKGLHWLRLNRGEFSVMIHPLLRDELKDHTDFALWMGD